MRTRSARASRSGTPPRSTGTGGYSASQPLPATSTTNADASSVSGPRQPPFGRGRTFSPPASLMPPPRSRVAARPGPERSAREFQAARSHVFGLRADQVILGVLLDHVRAPAGDAAAREHRDERARIEAQRLEHERRVELDVRLEIATRLQLVEHAQRGLLDAARQVEQLAILEVGLSHLLRDLAQHFGARVAHLVHAMAEPHDAPALGHFLAQPR